MKPIKQSTTKHRRLMSVIMAIIGLGILTSIGFYCMQPDKTTESTTQSTASDIFDYVSKVAVTQYGRENNGPVACQNVILPAPAALAATECTILTNESGLVVLIKGLPEETMNQISVLSPTQTVVENNTVGIQF